MPGWGAYSRNPSAPLPAAQRVGANPNQRGCLPDGQIFALRHKTQGRSHLFDAQVSASSAARLLRETSVDVRILLEALSASSAVCDWTIFKVQDLRR